jgi:peroxiredoxin
MQANAKEKNFPFKYLFDDGQKVYPQFGAQRTPHVYLLDANRYVRYIGAIDNNAQNADDVVTVKYLENAIAALSAGKNPEPAETKAIGCTIKVKS